MEKSTLGRKLPALALKFAAVLVVGQLVLLLNTLGMADGIGLGDEVAASNTGRMVSDSGDQPTCWNCSQSTYIERNKALSTAFCFEYDPGDAFEHWKGKCQKYQCANGFYYVWSGWTTFVGCEQTYIEDPGAPYCPGGTCAH